MTLSIAPVTVLFRIETGVAPLRGGFCERHFSWLCGMGAGECWRQLGRAAEVQKP